MTDMKCPITEGCDLDRCLCAEREALLIEVNRLRAALDSIRRHGDAEAIELAESALEPKP